MGQEATRPLDAERIESLLCTATAALRDLYCGWQHREVAAPDGHQGLESHLAVLVGALRGAGIDDDGAWDCDATEGIAVSAVAPPAGEEVDLLCCAATALRDLYNDWPHREIASPQGKGLDDLLRVLVTHLRGKGVDDDGGWDCDATEGIAVAAPAGPRP
jgi:hypothetical protein